MTTPDQPNHLTLGELIERLRAEPNQAKRVKVGLAEPHSYRGYYEQLAFEPTANTTVAEMLAAAEGALGATFQGYKGGDFVMKDYTDTWIAHYGDSGGETIGALLLDRLLADVVESEPVDLDGQPDDLDRLIAESMRDPDFARAFLAGQEQERQAAFKRGVAKGRRQATEGLRREWGATMRNDGRVQYLANNEAIARLAVATSHPGHCVVSRLVGPWEPAEAAPCPTCSGPSRRTVGMVCQTCGTDYGPDSQPAEQDGADR